MFVEFVVAHQSGADVVVLEQHARRSGVFCQYDVGFLQHPEGAEGDVLQIADWRGYEI